MSLEPSVEDHEALAETLRRGSARMGTRELASAITAGVGFVVAVAGLWLVNPPRPHVSVPMTLCVVVLALATRVRFHTPFGCAVPTQLAFVPLLFVSPPALVPAAVAVAWTLGRLPDVLVGRAPASRILHVPANSWYAVGPALVFAVAAVRPAHATAILLLGALGVQFVLDFAILALLDIIGTGTSFEAQIRETWTYAIDAAFSLVGLAFARGLHTTPAMVLGLIPLLWVLDIFARERHHRLDGLLELNRAYRGTAQVLGEVVEAEDGYTGAHCRSVVELALAVADELELDAEQRRNLEFAALLHDVGKITIPKEILNKPGALDPEEWKIMKSHVVEGEKMLARVGGFMRDVGQFVRSHHERWDGRGYPDALCGEQIPLEARIIACCDSWNAMRTDRPYRNALAYEVAVAEFLSNAGSQFDPSVVKALLAVTERCERGASDPSPARTLEPQPRPVPAAVPPPA